jgi:manganese/iron transport system ATP-binding protein
VRAALASQPPRRYSRPLMSHARHDKAKPVLEVSNLTVYLGGTLALENVSFSLHAGDSVAVAGPNGAGKSTLFKAVSGVIPYQSGKITVYGSEPGGHICIAYVPQASAVDWSFPVSVYDVVMMGRTGRIGYLKRPGRTDRSIVARSLGAVDMEAMSDRQIGELSGGQRQRVFLARALAQEAEIILLDEPLTGLDTRSQADIFSVLSGLSARGVTILVSTHDLQTASERFARVMLLNRELVALGKKEEVLTPELLLRTFGSHVSIHEGGGKKLMVYDSCCDHGDGERESG